MRNASGFSVIELLVATTIVLVLTGGLLAIVIPGPFESKARAAAIDIQERLRAATEAMEADIVSAGSGPVNGVLGRPFGAVAASLLPFRVGPQADPDGTVRADALTILAAPRVSAAAWLSGSWTPGGVPAVIAPAPGCPSGDASCGFRAGDAVLVLDGQGQADLFRVDAAAGALLTLSPPGRVSGRGFPAGSSLVPVVVSTYYRKPGPPGYAGQIMSGDGDQSDQPLVDHVVSLSFELLGEPRPPVLRAGATPLQANYGPSPPPPAVDDPRDTWGAGENCTFMTTPVGQVSRLSPLGAGTALVALAPAVLTDGPWCPDASAPGRYDADLLRIRAVRVTVRLEAGRREVRGAASGIFAHPGASRDPGSPAADQELVFDVVPRALQRGR